jgi:hypothetical protein
MISVGGVVVNIKGHDCANQRRRRSNSAGVVVSKGQTMGNRWPQPAWSSAGPLALSGASAWALHAPLGRWVSAAADGT